ncbi:hypothetical protein I7I51_05594 [Histoplasma capsulatum]|uniref:Uncharacterized protein n=1 Tax=Ajellomyces capsulatus TaxID=5037 RepID=A0A8A1M479_AJECA|nr:hypothetical protein I7I51_05594 [Histoplasma capsulatum]
MSAMKYMPEPNGSVSSEFRHSFSQTKSSEPQIFTIASVAESPLDQIIDNELVPRTTEPSTQLNISPVVDSVTDSGGSGNMDNRPPLLQPLHGFSDAWTDGLSQSSPYSDNGRQLLAADVQQPPYGVSDGWTDLCSTNNGRQLLAVDVQQPPYGVSDGWTDLCSTDNGRQLLAVDVQQPQYGVSDGWTNLSAGNHQQSVAYACSANNFNMAM